MTIDRCLDMNRTLYLNVIRVENYFEMHFRIIVQDYRENRRCLEIYKTNSVTYKPIKTIKKYRTNNNGTESKAKLKRKE